MTAVLSFTPRTDGLHFAVSSDGTIPPAEWSFHEIKTTSGRDARPDPLFRLLDDGDAEEKEDSTVNVPHEAIAGLSIHEGDNLGLPPRMDWTLVVRMEGRITSSESVADWYFEGSKGRPLIPSDRIGAILTISGKPYRLHADSYRTVAAVEAFNETRGQDPETRIHAWGKATELFPENVRADDYLKELRVCLADAFTLQPFLDDRGQADFDPVPGVWVTVRDDNDEPAEAFDTRIPDGPSGRFRMQFRKQGPRRNHPLGGGWYLTVSPHLVPILEEVRRIQESSAEVRLNFLRNPQSVLRQRLPEIDEDVLSQAFASEDYSDRVQGTGIWKPPVLPWIQKDPESWLPPERLGVRIDDAYVCVDPEDLNGLIDELEEARRAGQPQVEYRETAIPATQEAIDALRCLIGHAKPDEEGPLGNPVEKPDSDDGPRARVVLKVAENFEVLEYGPGDEPQIRPADPALDDQRLRLRNSPMPHQRTAIAWLQSHWIRGSSGALLADDMGLGKTFQALVFMAWLKSQMENRRARRRPFLVVAPTGLLENWVEEHSIHLDQDGLGTLMRAYGRDLKDLRQSPGKELEAGMALLDLQRIRNSGWVLTTYETLRDNQHSFAKIQFSVAVLDEVQKAKNPASGISQAVKTIHADVALCVTGTPVENRLADLWNILDIARPGGLGTLKDFSSRYEVESTEDQSPLVQLQEHLTTGQSPSIMLRRMKADHLQGLPERHDYHPSLPMPEPQRNAYDQVIELARSDDDSGKGAMLAILGKLRSISLHPFVRSKEEDAEYIEASARLKSTFEILDRIHETEEKVLVFLESREMQGTLASLVQRRYRLARRPMIINGSVSGPKRQKRVNAFQAEKGFDVLILSPRAGGVGLTLTAANHVVHLSRWWNPAVEDQCTDRIYRIGQEKSVHIYHPLAVHPELGEGSFDRILHGLLERKRELSREVLAPTSFSESDRRSLFDQAVKRVGSRQTGSPLEPEDIDTLSPKQFEEWVMRSFTAAGYKVDLTPHSGDSGVDGIARPTSGGNTPTLFVQVKHTQTGVNCNEKGVLELSQGHARYQTPGRRQLVLVTNAPSFTKRARTLADEHGVQLIARSQLGAIPRIFRSGA